MAMDIRGRLKDENEEIEEIKFTLDLPDGTTGGMVVSKAALETEAFSQKLLINLNAYTTTGANGTELNIDAIEALKEDPLYDAFKEDGSPKTGWRD